MDNRKTAFLILRVSESLKNKIVKLAKQKGQSLSEFVRGVIDSIIK